jgi:phosphoserine phosphatase RsbU/P
MNRKELSEQLSSKFFEYEVGTIMKYVEPTTHFITLEDFVAVYRKEEDITCVPVEYGIGVAGLVDINKIAEKNKSFWEHIKGSTIEKFVNKDVLIVEAKEHVDKVIELVLSRDETTFDFNFLIFYHGVYIGLGNFNKLLQHVTQLRNLELRRAKEIQEYFMNMHTIKDVNFEVEVFTHMAHMLGGDFYKLIKINDHLSMAACFDVSGKNISASLLTSSLNSFFITFNLTNTLETLKPAKLIALLNDLINRSTHLDIFIASILVFIDMEEKKIKIFNHGYSYVYIFQKENGKTTCKKVKPFLPPLGIIETSDLKIKEYVIPISKGLKLVTYSDGFIDARNPDGKQYGEERAQKFLLQNYNKSSKNLVKEIENEYLNFIKTAPKTDDVTALVIHFT